MDSGRFTVAVKVEDSEGRFNLDSKGIVVASKIEDSIDRAVKQQAGVDVKTDCGNSPIRIAKTGETFECEVTTPQGEKQAAKVTFKDEDGNVDFEL